MDGTRFDRLIQQLSQHRSRRDTLLGLCGAALVSLGLTAPGAAKKHKNKKKKAVCLCPNEEAEDCHQGKVPAKKAKKLAGQACNYSGRCQVGVVATRCRCGSGGRPCRVFVTSTTQDGNLGGLVGADAICQNLAEAADLPGTYKAWLSDDTGSPSTRFVKSTTPYQLVDGTTIADDWTDLTTEKSDGTYLAAPIDLTETGAQQTVGSFIWTGTKASGEVENAGRHCQNWSVNVYGQYGLNGRVGDRGDGWTGLNANDCHDRYPLYCFQQS